MLVVLLVLLVLVLSLPPPQATIAMPLSVAMATTIGRVSAWRWVGVVEVGMSVLSGATRLEWIDSELIFDAALQIRISVGGVVMVGASRKLRLHAGQLLK